jgi:hypothetical protein
LLYNKFRFLTLTSIWFPQDIEHILFLKNYFVFFSSFSAVSIQAGSANIRRTCPRNVEQVRRICQKMEKLRQVRRMFAEPARVFSTNLPEKTRAGSPNRRTCSSFFTKVHSKKNVVQSGRFGECSSTNLPEIFRAGSANIRPKNSSRFGEPARKNSSRFGEFFVRRTCLSGPCPNRT